MKPDRSGLNWEVSVGVTFASFMSAVTLFFTGLLIAQYKSFDSTIKVPLLFLIISTFSFIFAASVYSNAGIEITVGKLETVKRFLIYANNILEFLGLYLFIIATPLVIGTVTSDNFLRLSTMLIAIVGLTLYSQSAFSILHKEARTSASKFGLTLAIIVPAIALYFSQALTRLNYNFGYSYIAAVQLVVIGAIAFYFSSKSQQYVV